MLRQRLSADPRSLRSMSSAPQRTATAGLGTQGPSKAFGELSAFASSFAPATETAATRETAASNISAYGTPVSIVDGGGIQWARYLTGLIPESDQALITYHRDCYQFDSVAGATVDMQCSYPFSDFVLVGVEDPHADVYNEACSRLDVRTLMGSIARDFLVDGAFVGSLVYDSRARTFQDVMQHDYGACQVTPSPFFNSDAIIQMTSANRFSTFINSDSPFLQSILASYPQEFLDVFRNGNVNLDPLTTLYIPRRGTRDQNTTSYLRRILPAYLLEKTLYRGTLLEAHRRMRSPSLVTAGTDLWEPTTAELDAILARLQASEADPLGAWIVMRNGVQVQDIKTAGDFWKWTDLIESLVPYKLRALGASEAFLSGEAAYATSEVAMTVFTENAAAFRSYLTNKVFRDKVFPLIAVTNSFYRDPKLADKGRSIEAVMRNLGNPKNLVIPELRWHKNLDNRDPGYFDMLEKLGEKNVPVPLKMWAAATGVDLEMLMGELREDQQLRDRIEAITGKRPNDAVNQGNPEGADDFGAGGDNAYDEGNDFDGGYGEAARVRAELQSLEFKPISNALLSRRRPLLSRSFVFPDGTPMDEVVQPSRSGKKVHAVYNQKAAKDRQNAQIAAAATALRDPNHYARVKAAIESRIGAIRPIFNS